MARPIDHEKRRALAEEAIDVLRRKGLHLSNKALAEQLGLKRPTLLYYFPTKAEIFEASLESLLAEQVVFVIERMEAEDHPLKQLWANVTAIHEFHHGREERIVFLTQAIAMLGIDRSTRFIEIGNQAFAAQRAVMRERCNQAIADGRMHPCDVDSLLRLIRGCNDGLMVQRVMTGCDLAPVHQFLWDNVLAPLMREEKK